MWQPPIGRTLGCLSNQLQDGEFIWWFQALGPKNYRYETRSETDPTGETLHTEIKCKGLTLTLGLKKVLDGNVYEALLNQRIMEFDQFYEKLHEVGGGSKAIDRAEAVYWQTIEKHPEICSIFLLSPTLVKDETGQIREDEHRVCLVRMTFDKRR